MRRTWRDRARPVIRQVLAEHEGADDATIRRALREAYPFGRREMWPYKVWLDEIHVQRFGRQARNRSGKPIKPPPEPDPNQLELLGGS